MSKTTRPHRIVDLYWVTTDDHDEDWFILAKTRRAAESYHIEYEGYEPGDARALNRSYAQERIRSRARYHGTPS